MITLQQLADLRELCNRPPRGTWQTDYVPALADTIERLVGELENIAKAERFNREKFDDDSAFADWVQSRARALLAELDKEKP